MNEYIPSPSKHVADQVELYEGSGGTKGSTYIGLPVIIVTNKGCKTDAIRKTPLMKVTDGDNYILIASMGGAPENPVWYNNLKADSNVEIRDETQVYSMKAIEVIEPDERKRLWNIAIKTYPPYQEYQKKTDRVIPVFLAKSNY